MADRQDMEAGTQSGRQRVVGETDHPQHRVPPGQGNDAPFAADADKLPEMSIFDGKGNESVVVLAEDDHGKLREGTGPDRESAVRDARNPKTVIGEAFSPEEH